MNEGSLARRPALRAQFRQLRVAIVNSAPFVRTNGQAWLNPDEWKSLEQWAELLDDVTLWKPESRRGGPPEGWLRVPPEVGVERLCFDDDPLRERRRSTLRAARSALGSCDLLYARMPNYEAFWCYQAVKGSGIRLLVELHGDWETSIREEDARGFLRHVTRRLRILAARRFVREMTRNADCILSVGPALLEPHGDAGVPSFVSTNHLLRERDYRPREEFALKQPPRILFVGAIQRRKGLHFLFRGLALLAAEGRTFEMVMIGMGPQQAELEELAASGGFRDSVRFLGQLPHGEEIFSWYRTSDVFVLPSVAAEGVPRVTHEAMALGCPVIATSIAGIPWQLRDGAGVLVPPGDPTALADALRSVLDDSDLRRALAERGYRRSLEHTIERQQETIAEVLGVLSPA